MGGCLTSVIRAILITECLLLSVTADGAETDDQIDIKFVLIGAGIGLLLAIALIVIKLYMVRKHMLDNNIGLDTNMKRPSETLSFRLTRSGRGSGEDGL